MRWLEKRGRHPRRKPGPTAADFMMVIAVMGMLGLIGPWSWWEGFAVVWVFLFF